MFMKKVMSVFYFGFNTSKGEADCLWCLRTAKSGKVNFRETRLVNEVEGCSARRNVNGFIKSEKRD